MFIQDEMNEMTKPSSICFFEHALTQYHKLNVLLQACGHDTCELKKAMIETQESIEKLKAVRVKAEEEFKEKGILFTVVPFEGKEEKKEAPEEPGCYCNTCKKIREERNPAQHGAA